MQGLTCHPLGAVSYGFHVTELALGPTAEAQFIAFLSLLSGHDKQVGAGAEKGWLALRGSDTLQKPSRRVMIIGPPTVSDRSHSIAGSAREAYP